MEQNNKTTKAIFLQLPYYYRCSFRDETVHRIEGNSEWKVADLCIAINRNYIWSECEFDRHIGLKHIVIFIESGSVSNDAIVAYINEVMKARYGYVLTETVYDNGDRSFECKRSTLCLVYITDVANPTIQKCKDSLYGYCNYYKYNFLHMYTNELHDYRDPKDRIEVLATLHYQEDYIFVMYNYSLIVNQKMPLSMTADTIFTKNTDVQIKFDTEFGMPLLDNFAFRNSSRAIDILREVAYFVYDPDKLMKYIRQHLFKEVNYTTFYSYFNKRIVVGQGVVSFDLGYNLNTLALTHMDQVNMLVNYYKNHQSVFEPILKLCGKTYVWGSDNKGCLGQISFSSWYTLKTTWGKTGTYKWIHANQYVVEIAEEQFKITVYNDGNSFIGYSEKGSNCVRGVFVSEYIDK
jgi:hypothetical protein